VEPGPEGHILVLSLKLRYHPGEMNYSDDFISGVYARAMKAVKLTPLVSGTLPIDHDSAFEVMLLSDSDENCALFVMTAGAELLRCGSFEWTTKCHATERLFKLCDYISPADWAQMDAANDCTWNLRKLDDEVILRILAEGCREIGGDFDPVGWRKRQGRRLTKS